MTGAGEAPHRKESSRRRSGTAGSNSNAAQLRGGEAHETLLRLSAKAAPETTMTHEEARVFLAKLEKEKNEVDTNSSGSSGGDDSGGDVSSAAETRGRLRKKKKTKSWSAEQLLRQRKRDVLRLGTMDRDPDLGLMADYVDSPRARCSTGPSKADFHVRQHSSGPAEVFRACGRWPCLAKEGVARQRPKRRGRNF